MNEGIDWTLTFDQFITKISERKEAKLKSIMERSEGPFDAAKDFKDSSIWALYDTIDTYRRALKDACQHTDINDNIDAFSYFVNKNRIGRDEN
jgi:hypothetical protein